MRPYPAAHCSPISRNFNPHPPPLPVPFFELIFGRNGKEWWSKISHRITPGWRWPFFLSLFIPWLQHSHVRKVLLTSGKHTPVTPKNPHVAEEADYSQFLVVLNFSFVLQYTHMLVFIYTDAIEINWKAFLEINSRRVFWATKIVKWSKQHQPEYGQVLGQPIIKSIDVLHVCIEEHQNETTITKTPKLA